MQSFMGANVLLSQHLLTRRADGAVELGVGVRLPNVLFVLFGFGGALFLFDSEVVVSREQLLLLRRVRQQHQQLLKDLPEVLPKQLPATFVVLCCRNQTLPELPRMSFKLIELGLIALQKLFDGLYELNVPLLEVFRYQV